MCTYTLIFYSPLPHSLHTHTQGSIGPGGEQGARGRNGATVSTLKNEITVVYVADFGNVPKCRAQEVTMEYQASMERKEAWGHQETGAPLAGVACLEQT